MRYKPAGLPSTIYGSRTKTKYLHLGGAQKPGLYRIVVTQRGFWRLRGCPRHGGHLANEWIGRFTVAPLADCHRRIITVLSFYLAGRCPGRLEQPTEPSDWGLPLVSRGGR